MYKKISHSTKETTDFLACLRRFERPTPALGVLKNSQNPIKISNFRTFLGVLSNIFRLNRLFSFVFSANFRFQNNFQTKIIPKTIPIFIAVFKKFNAIRHSFFGCYDTKLKCVYQANGTPNFLLNFSINCKYIKIPYFIAFRCCCCSTSQRQ